MLTLEAKNRVEIGTKSLKGLREAGSIPAVMYGKKHETVPLSINAREFTKLFKVAGESTVISLSGLGGDKQVLIHEVDLDPVLNIPRHIDFYLVDKDAKVRVNIPIEFVGTSPAVKDLGGILLKVVHEFEVEALPKDLPHEIVVDISSLVNFESQIAVKDLSLPNGVATTLDPEEIVAAVSVAAEEEVEEAPAEIDMEAISVEKKGKEDEGDTEDKTVQ